MIFIRVTDGNVDNLLQVLAKSHHCSRVSFLPVTVKHLNLHREGRNLFCLVSLTYPFPRCNGSWPARVTCYYHSCSNFKMSMAMACLEDRVQLQGKVISPREKPKRLAIPMSLLDPTTQGPSEDTFKPCLTYHR